MSSDCLNKVYVGVAQREEAIRCMDKTEGSSWLETLPYTDKSTLSLEAPRFKIHVFDTGECTSQTSFHTENSTLNIAEAKSWGCLRSQVRVFGASHCQVGPLLRSNQVKDYPRLIQSGFYMVCTQPKANPSVEGNVVASK